CDRGHRAERILGVRVNIRDLHEPSFEYRAGHHCAPTWRRGICATVDLKYFCGKAAVRYEMQELAVEPVDKAKLGLAEPRCALGDHVKHRLDVGWRATDCVEHLAGRSLVFERLGQLAAACLHLVE